MRISDWSSDVCSSDLQASGVDHHRRSGGFLCGPGAESRAVAPATPGNAMIAYNPVDIGFAARGSNSGERMPCRQRREVSDAPYTASRLAHDAGVSVHIVRDYVLRDRKGVVEGKGVEVSLDL